MSKCYFKLEWINNPNFYWLQEIKNDRKVAYCVLCKVKFSLSNMGLRAVTSHQNGKKHRLREKSANSSESVLKAFPIGIKLEPSENNSSIIAPTTEEVVQACSQVDSQQQNEFSMMEAQSSGSIKKYLLKDNVTEAEILWCLATIMTHKSLRSAAKNVQIFPKMFPDSQIAKGMQLGRDKMAYTIIYGISSFFKQNLISELQSCIHFVVGFDESINKVTQKQQMDINVRFWCSKTNKVKTQYFNSAFLGRTRSSDLLAAFKKVTEPLDLRKLLQVSMDGPNVNTKFFRELQEDIHETNEEPETLNMGSCGLHAVNVAFKTGAISTGWKITEFLRSLYYVFKDSPARRSLYTYYSNSDVFPKKFCAIRWLENSSVAERALDILPNIKSFIEGVEKDKIIPTSKSYLEVKRAISDKLLSSELAFFAFVARNMESFLREYQTDIPLVPFLYNDLSSLMMRFIERFVQTDHLKKKNVMDIDVMDKSIFLPTKLVDIGIATQCQLGKSNATESEKVQFRKECREFLSKCVTKLKERSPLIYELTRAVSCFDPKISVNQNLFSKRLTKLLLILCQKNWLSSTTADQANNQFKKICSAHDVVLKLKSYKRSERIDTFWFNIFSEEENCDEAISVTKIVMILSHGNANIERGFSINNECLWENMKEESLIARRTVYDSIMTKGGDLRNIEISKQMVLHVRNARVKFAEAAEKRRKEEKEKAGTLKREREQKLEIRKLEAKKAKLLKETRKESDKIEEEITTLRHLHKKF